MYVETVGAGQAIPLVGVCIAWTGRGPGTHKAATLCLTVRAVARSCAGAFMLHRYNQFTASGKLQRIRRMTATIADGRTGRGGGGGSAGVRAYGVLAIPLATHKLVTLAGKEYAELVAKVVFEVN